MGPEARSPSGIRPDPGRLIAAKSSGGAASTDLESEPGTLLTSRDVEAIAEATARKLMELVREPGRIFALVDARELAEGLGVSLDYVYAHARELGAMRLGSGPKARIRFDLDRARQALELRSSGAAGRRAR
jgi:hypothetical protein